MLFDLHNDFPTVVRTERFGDCVRGADAVTSVIWTSKFDRGSALARTESLTNELCALGVPVAIEDMGFMSDGGLYERFDFSRYFYCSLTWNYDNTFAGGALADGRLTNVGKCAIKCMNGKCAVDLAHLNRESFYAALDVAARPMCSHTGFNAHPRSLDCNQILALTARRAPIGLSVVTKFTDAYSAEQFAQMIDGFVQRYGIECLCIGSDFYGTDDMPRDLKSYADFDTVKSVLYGLGYSKTDTEKIFYGNARRFYEEIQHDRHL